MITPKQFRFLGRLCHTIHEPFDDPDVVIYRYWRASKQRWEYASCDKFIVVRDLFNDYFDRKGKPRPQVTHDDFISAIQTVPTFSDLIKLLDK